MQSFAVFATLVAVACGQMSTTPGFQCNPQVLRTCADGYYARFPTSTTADKASVASWRAFLAKLFDRKKVDAFKQQCGAWNEFNMCIEIKGHTKPEPCFDPAFLRQYFNIGTAEAYKLVAFATQYDMECINYTRAGVLANYACFDKAATAAMPTITNCINTFGAAPPAQICNSTQTFVTCVSAPFKTTCDSTVANLFCANAATLVDPTRNKIGCGPAKCDF